MGLDKGFGVSGFLYAILEIYRSKAYLVCFFSALCLFSFALCFSHGLLVLLEYSSSNNSFWEGFLEEPFAACRASAVISLFIIIFS